VSEAVQPHTRFKLSAPVPKESGGRSAIRCGTIPIVNPHSLRRSLSAIR